jgi:ribosome maturation factor RimP
MYIAHEKLNGLNRDKLIAAVEPVLSAHSVECVELVWRTDRAGWVLEVTIERPETRVPGAGVTIDLCSEIARDLSAALDVADCIPSKYSLEVGSPGVERALYAARDYARFAGQKARVKLKEPLDGQSVVRGTLHGLDDQGRVVLETERGELVNIAIESVDSGRLVFEWHKGGPRPNGAKHSPRGKSGQGRKSKGHSGVGE